MIVGDEDEKGGVMVATARSQKRGAFAGPRRDVDLSAEHTDAFSETDEHPSRQPALEAMTQRRKQL